MLLCRILLYRHYAVYVDDVTSAAVSSSIVSRVHSPHVYVLPFRYVPLLSLLPRVYTGPRTVTVRPDASGYLSEVAVEELSMPADLDSLTRQKLKDRH